MTSRTTSDGRAGVADGLAQCTRMRASRQHGGGGDGWTDAAGLRQENTLRTRASEGSLLERAHSLFLLLNDYTTTAAASYWSGGAPNACPLLAGAPYFIAL